jgi:hypothetical protein
VRQCGQCQAVKPFESGGWHRLYLWSYQTQEIMGAGRHASAVSVNLWNPLSMMAGTTHHFMVASNLINHFYAWANLLAYQKLAPSAGTMSHLVAMGIHKASCVFLPCGMNISPYSVIIALTLMSVIIAWICAIECKILLQIFSLHTHMVWVFSPYIVIIPTNIVAWFYATT